MEAFFRHLRKQHRTITAVLLVVSLLSLLFSPAAIVKDRVLDTAPSLLAGIVITEGLFILGIIIMASAVSFSLARNPFRWRQHLTSLARQVGKTRLFWLGFWINAVGALGSGLLLAYGVVRSLPVTSWGLLWIPIGDVLLTLAVRSSLIELHRSTLARK